MGLSDSGEATQAGRLADQRQAGAEAVAGRRVESAAKTAEEAALGQEPEQQPAAASQRPESSVEL